jgi:two-component system NtrC family sensor kinase
MPAADPHARPAPAAPPATAPRAAPSGPPPAPRRWTNYLSFRLFVVLCALLLPLLAASTWILLRVQTRQMMDMVLLSADRTSDIIQRSTRSAMLRNQRAELHEMINNMASEPGLQGIRVFNKQGDIMFSSDPAEVGRRVDLQAEACYRCHAAGTPPPSLRREDRARIFAAADGQRVLGLIGPIPNAPDCSTADCHAHGSEQTVLGVLDVRMSLASVDSLLAGVRRNLQLAAVALVLVVATGLAALIYRLVQVPVARLIEGTRAVSAGRLDHRIDVRTGSDMGLLADAFNGMTRELQRVEAENRDWARTLEDKVRMKTEELQRAQAHLVQMDKMASLGKLSATVAHEINNPLAGVLTYARLLDRDLAEACPDSETRTDMSRYLGMITSETRRCGSIVQNLLSFARTSGSQMAPVRLDALVEASVALVQHHMDLRSIRVERRAAGGDDEATCSQGEIQQALLSLLVNSSEAMTSPGTIEVTTELTDTEARIAVRDQGSGIPPEVLPRIFEPFFTTKSATKGVGLGLAVVYGIMQRHGGRVDVSSKVDVGSVFTLVWPRGPHSRAEASAPAASSPRSTT